MRAPAFWWRSSPSLLALLLAPIGWIWGEIAGRRMQRSGQDADARVLCIGNFTAGGAGKTPTALACAAILSQQGYKPAFLTRGYAVRWRAMARRIRSICEVIWPGRPETSPCFWRSGHQPISPATG